MKILSVSKGLLLQTAAALFVALLFVVNETALALVVENRRLLLSIFGLLVSAPLWVAYGRLNNLDSTDGLKVSQARIVGDFAVAAKNILLRYFAGSVFFVVTVFIAWMVGGVLPVYKLYLLAISVGALIVFLIVAVSRIVETLVRVEKTLQDVTNWRLEEKERSKQIESLKRARTESKLVPDDKLLGYRMVGWHGEPDNESAPSEGDSLGEAGDR